MYRAILDKPLFLADHRVEPETLLLEDVTAAAVLLLRCGRVEPCEPTLAPEVYRNVLIIRPGGIGDLLFLTPIIHELVQRGIAVTVCTHPHYFPILSESPCKLLPYPQPERIVRAFDKVVWMQDCVEESTDETNIVDLFSARAGVELADDKKACIYTVTEEERAWAKERFPRNGKPRVGIQPKASSDCRNYPERQFMAVASILIAKGYEVVLFGSPGSMKADPLYLCLPAHGLDIRQSAAVLEGCDAFIGPDSAGVHIAGALRVPCVALYGPFSWQSRTKYHPTTFGINGQAACAPCHHHARTDPWVPGKPCSTAKMCVALAQIDPQRIVQKVEAMILR